MNIKINKPQSIVTEVGFHQKKGEIILVIHEKKKLF